MRYHSRFASVILLIFACTRPSCGSEGPLSSKVDPRVKLLSVVFRLAGNPEYNMSPLKINADCCPMPFPVDPRTFQFAEFRLFGAQWFLGFHFGGLLLLLFSREVLRVLACSQKSPPGSAFGLLMKSLCFRALLQTVSKLLATSVRWCWRPVSLERALLRRSEARARFAGSRRSLRPDTVRLPVQSVPATIRRRQACLDDERPTV
jgi:hypothetical protein